MDIPIRITKLVRVRASTLLPHPHNFRRHPETQRAALRAQLDALGYAGAALAYENTAGGLVLIDGHLRAEEAGDEVIPVLVTDLSPDEALIVLGTSDPLAGMAGLDDVRMGELRTRVGPLQSQTEALLDELADRRLARQQGGLDGTEYDQEVTAGVIWLECPDCGHRWPR